MQTLSHFALIVPWSLLVLRLQQASPLPKLLTQMEHIKLSHLTNSLQLPLITRNLHSKNSPLSIQPLLKFVILSLYQAKIHLGVLVEAEA